MKIRAAVLEEFGRALAVQELDEVNTGLELMEAQDGIRSVIGFA